MAKKVLIILLIVLLCGCSQTNNQNSTSQEYTYQAYYTAIKDNTKYVAGSDYFNIEAEMSQLPNGNYLYYVFIDEPIIAMFNIKALVMENDYIYDENDGVILPTIGIFDDTTVNMIPNQIDTDLGYQKGIVLSGEASSESIVLDLIVTWDNQDKSKSFREFYQIELNMDGFTFVDTVTTSNSSGE